MGIIVEEVSIDDRGRVVIPSGLRTQLNLRPNQKMRAEVRNGALVLLPEADTARFVSELRGCVAGSRVKPERLKEIWGADHDHN